MISTSFVINFLSALTLVGQIGLVIILSLLVFKKISKKQNFCNKLFSFIEKQGVLIGLVLSFFGVFGSLYFSEIVGFTPCALCWVQRIFVYPQFIIFAIAAFRKINIEVFWNSLVLSVLGVYFAAYHYVEQMMAIANTTDTVEPCSLFGEGPSCTAYYFLKFGSITIPMMSLTISLLLLALSLFMVLRNRK